MQTFLSSRLGWLVLCVAAFGALADEVVTAPEVRVSGPRDSEDPSGRAETTLGRAELRRRDVGTLGTAVGESPGVHNSSFGPGVGLPVIRGLTGPRVRVNVGGIGTHDASSLSPDHAAAAEPVLASQIRVVRGPSTVRYGSNAIGGVVEVEDGRIPKARPQRGTEKSLEARYNTNGSGRTGAVRVDGAAGPFVLHVDGFARARENISIPGKPIDEAAVMRQFGLRPIDNPVGFVPNTDLKAHGGTVGASAVGSSGFAGFSVGSMENQYGIPSGAHVHAHGSGMLPGMPTHGGGDNVRIDMQQTRVDGHAMLLLPTRFLEAVEVRSGWVNYRHDELDSGRPVTTFRNRALESRVELQHRWTQTLSGAVGLHRTTRQFSALGEEAFVPVSDIAANALYVTQQYELGRLRIEGSARQERQRIETQPQNTVFGTVETYPVTTFRPASWAIGATWQHDARNALYANWSHSQRAPEVQELYSFGPHLATRVFALGTPTLQKESIVGPDAGVRAGRGRYDVAFNVYDYRAGNYIFQENTGFFYNTDEREFQARCLRLDLCLPVQRYTQREVRLSGYEAQLNVALPKVRGAGLRLQLFTDFVRARYADGTGDVPRIPPRRAGAELSAQVGERWGGRVRYTHAFAQDKAGVNETPTAAYDLLNLYVDYRVRRDAEGRELTLFLNATNLLDQEIRNATSFLRSFAPEPGRAFEIGVRASF